MFTARELIEMKSAPDAFARKLNTAITNATDAGNAVKIGTIANLTTTDKTSLVLAINELVAKVTALEARIAVLEA